MTFLELNHYLFSRLLSPVAVVLLDVENFPFKLNLEDYIRPYCQYPITIKFAVANWQNNSISKLDLHLHQQRYQLIHVPKEKNAADAQIITIGSSLLLYHPQIKEVVIVSNDFIFNYLNTTLQLRGCQTYKVYQQSGNIYLHTFANNRTIFLTKTGNNEEKYGGKSQGADKHNEFEQQLKEQIKQTLIKLSNNCSNKQIALTQLCQQFQKDYTQPLSKILKSKNLSKSPSKFIKKSFSQEIDIKLTGNTYYLCLKKE
jgi:small nuclear ribonucleoprotein (snRNP)-like protein